MVAQPIVHAFEIDERTVARRQERAGQQCQKVHTDQVMQANLDLHHVQADHEKVKPVGGRRRCTLQAWPEILVGTVIKKTTKKRVVEVIWRMGQGTLERAHEVLADTRGGNGVS